MKILIIAAIAFSGKCILLKADADLSEIDETKLTRLTMEVTPATTGHQIKANELVFDVLEEAHITPDESGGYSARVYGAAHRLALGIVRCESLAINEDEKKPPTVADILALPTVVQDKYLLELDKADRFTEEEWSFFKKPAAEVG